MKYLVFGTFEIEVEADNSEETIDKAMWNIDNADFSVEAVHDLEDGEL